MIEAGKTYVVINVNLGAPCHCNSENFPRHPCRVTVSKVGRKFAYAPTSGCKSTKFAFKDLMPIDEAKAVYRAALLEREAYGASLTPPYQYLTAQQIDLLVANL